MSQRKLNQLKRNESNAWKKLIELESEYPNFDFPSYLQMANLAACDIKFELAANPFNVAEIDEMIERLTERNIEIYLRDYISTNIDSSGDYEEEEEMEGAIDCQMSDADSSGYIGDTVEIVSQALLRLRNAREKIELEFEKANSHAPNAGDYIYVGDNKSVTFGGVYDSDGCRLEFGSGDFIIADEVKTAYRMLPEISGVVLNGKNVGKIVTAHLFKPKFFSKRDVAKIRIGDVNEKFNLASHLAVSVMKVSSHAN